MARRTSEDVIDADIDLGPERSGFGAFLRGAVLGAALVAAVALAAILATPPPADLPLTGRVEIVDRAPVAEGEPFEAETEPFLPEPPAEGEPFAADAPAGAGVPGEAAPDPDAPPPSGPAVAVVPQQGEAAAEEEAPAGPEAAPAGDPPLTAAPGEAGRETLPGGGEPATSEPAAVPGAEVPEPAPPGEATGVAAAPAAGAEPVQGAAALTDNARPFDAPRQSPLLAVVLTGDAVSALSAERLSLLTMPLTVAVPPDAPNAAEIGAAARAAGHEVLADLSLAEDPAAERIAALDMAVGATATGGAGDADVLAPVLGELDRHGFAWVDPGAGISTPAERIARELGMAYTQGNRVVGGDASPEQIYREIDSAARQARQWGSSVLFLDAGEPALQALVRWGLEQHSDNAVWFAPVSAVIERRSAL